MTSFFQHPDHTTPVHTATKSIKLYSDNPIHDCIDRMIESSTLFDSTNSDKEHCIALLREAAEDLADICIHAQSLISIQNIKKYHGDTIN
jgi:hypothetical protein